MCECKTDPTQNSSSAGGLVTNDGSAAPTTATPIVHVTMNLSPMIRHDSMEGRPYIVVPMIMLTEGVHAGSNGPLYYPGDELAKTPMVWNHKPIVVYHPQINGVGVSACDPIILTNRKIGIILNARFEDGKLHAEAWLEVERVKLVDNRILESLEAGKTVELSTGLFTDNETTEGTWNDEGYTAIARNYRPDHLAILPDKKGACSIEDGAGLLRLNEEIADLKQQIQTLTSSTTNGGLTERRSTMDKKLFIDSLIANSEWVEADREMLMGMSDDQLKRCKVADAPKPTDNANPKPAPKKIETPKTPTDNDAPKPVTVASYIENAPLGIRDMLASGLRAHEAEKVRYVTAITANERNVFTPEQLNAKCLTELQQIAALLPPVSNGSPTYHALADMLAVSGVPVGNTGSPVKAPEPMAPTPEISFN